MRPGDSGPVLAPLRLMLMADRGADVTPWQFSETPAKPGVAPELGGHDDAVLGELGYSPAEVADLRAWRII